MLRHSRIYGEVSQDQTAKDSGRLLLLLLLLLSFLSVSFAFSLVLPFIFFFFFTFYLVQLVDKWPLVIFTRLEFFNGCGWINALKSKQNRSYPEDLVFTSKKRQYKRFHFSIITLVISTSNPGGNFLNDRIRTNKS